MSDHAVTLRPENAVETTQQQPSIAQILKAAVDKGVTTENVAVVERLAELMWKSQERDDAKEFARALNALQSELPTIVATSVIPNRGKYERFEDVMRQIQPFLTKHGFTVSFSNDFREGRVIETCHLSHGGHTRTNSFAVRVGGKADSETQADCKAATTAKRNALLNALNIVIRQDCLDEEHDAAMEGDPNLKVTEEQAEELERRAKLTNSNIPAFLKLAGPTVTRFADIPRNRYDELDQAMRRKESGR